MIVETYPKISDDPEVQRLYEESRECGESHRFAEMVALRKGPGLNTDTRWMAGRNETTNLPSDPKVAAQYVRQAKAAGVSVSGKVYSPLLARFPGDPKAWLSSKADARRLCQEKQLAIRPTESDKGYTVAPDIVDGEVDKIVAQAGEKPTPKERAQLTEVTRARLSGAQD